MFCFCFSFLLGGQDAEEKKETPAHNQLNENVGVSGKSSQANELSQFINLFFDSFIKMPLT